MTISMTSSTQNPPLNEVQLARQARTSAEAFAELYHRYVQNIYRYHMAHTGNLKDAEDLTSQTFVAALEGIRSFRGRGPFVAWLMGIARRKRMLHFRNRRPELSLESVSDIPSPALSTDKAAAQRLQIQAVHRALGQISSDRAEAITLCIFGNLTCSEAGHALGKSEAAVKMLLSRGLQDLRERTSLALEVEP
jgi:RNA polymerase sigma-70 factor, ECF subfamily